MDQDRAARVARYVREILDRDAISAEDLAVLAAPGVQPLEKAAGPVAAPALLPSDIDLVRMIQDGRPLTPQQTVRVEAIVIPNGLRPAFDIAHDSFDQLPNPWTRLNERRPELVPLIQGIGRVDLVGHPTKKTAGTAFVVAADGILTNRHVAEFFIDGVGDAQSLQFKPGMSATVDLKQEITTTDSITLTVTAPALILDTWDVALLRVSGIPAGVRPLPLASAAPPSLDNRLAAVVGYPVIDEHSDVIEQINIFRGVFFKKRLMPGRLTGMKATDSFGRSVKALAHDCTTLGGNSGSVVIDVESGRVVGVHFSGEPLVANFAVPTWELACDGRLARAGVSLG